MHRCTSTAAQKALVQIYPRRQYNSTGTETPSRTKICAPYDRLTCPPGSCLAAPPFAGRPAGPIPVPPSSMPLPAAPPQQLCRTPR
eukprot:1439893-Rhodomonas_salina.3